MTEALMHPALPLFAGALLVAWSQGPLRAALAVIAPLVALGLVWHAADGARWIAEIAGSRVVPFVVDPLSRLFATIFAIAGFVAALFANGQTSRLELPAALLYAGAALGVVFAGDLLTVFVFWELLAVGSTLVIWSAGTERAFRASMRYLMVHLLGGMLLLIGIAGHYLDAGSLEFTRLSIERPSDVLILIAVLVNAAAWPVSAWLPDAYPEASWSGTVFLSAFTTKVAAYVLMRGFPGTELLIVVGLVMVVYGLVYALREDDMRRVLAYGIVNQVGFMVTAVGIGSELALNGAAAHAFNHILYKALLLMAAGSVLFATGRRRLSELGGLYRSMPQTTLLAIVGALAMAAMPLTSGFVTKSMIPAAAGDAHLLWPWLLLHVASGGALLIALRFLWFVFFGRDSGLRPSDPPLDMRLAMVVLAVGCIGIGVVPDLLYPLLPWNAPYEPYTGWHVVAQLQILFFAGLAFFVLLAWLGRQRGTTWDVDWLYRHALPVVLGVIAGVGSSIAAALRRSADAVQDLVATQIRRAHGPQGIFARTWTIRTTGMWMMVLLLGMLVVGYLG